MTRVSERVALAQKIEELEQPKATERMEAGVTLGSADPRVAEGDARRAGSSSWSGGAVVWPWRRPGGAGQRHGIDYIAATPRGVTSLARS
jgi:hypothetical protein